MRAEVVAVVLAPDEVELVMRAVGALMEDEGPSADALAVVEILSGAVAPDALAGFEEWVR